MVWRHIFVLVFMPALVFADSTCKPFESFYKDSHRGWFYREECVQDNQTAPEKATANTPRQDYRIMPDTVEIPWGLLNKIDPSDIAEKIEPEARKISMVNPSEHNVTEYSKLVAFIVERSSAWSSATQYATTTNPAGTFPYMASMPTNIWARDAMATAKATRKSNILAEYSDKAGFMVISSPTCPYCTEQVEIMEYFKNDYGWNYMMADINEAPELAGALDIRTIPDIFIVVDRNGEAVWQRIATGLTTQSELESAVIYGLTMMGEINE